MAGHWVERIWTSPQGERVPYRCFVPPPVTGTVVRMDSAEFDRLRSAEEEVRAFAHDERSPVSDWLISHTEGASSTTVEGVHPSLRRLARSEATGEGRQPEKAALRNIAATEQALRIGSDASRPFAVEDIRAVHETLMADDPEYEWATPGAVRRTQNWIGGGDLRPNPAKADFVSPPPDAVGELMDDLVDYMNTSGTERALVQAAVAHARFEHIHPFPDGNGRTGRALIHMLWARRGLVTDTSTVPVSAYLARHRDEYFEALGRSHRAIADGAAEPDRIWGPMIGLLEEATVFACHLGSAIRFAAAEIRDRWEQAVAPKRKSLVGQILRDLTLHPVLDSKMVAERYGRTERRARQALQTLGQAGVLDSRSIGKGRRGYEAAALLDLCSAASSEHPIMAIPEVTSGLRLNPRSGQRD